MADEEIDYKVAIANSLERLVSHQPPEDLEQKVNSFLTAQGLDELFAVAMLTKCISAKEALTAKRDLLTERCFGALTINYSKDFEKIEELLCTISDSQMLSHAKDSNAIRIATALQKHTGERNWREKEQTELLSTFPALEYKKQHLLADLLSHLFINRLSPREAGRMDRWFTEEFLSILTASELQLRDDSEKNKQLFLEELNTLLAKQFPGTTRAADYPEILRNMDLLIGFSKGDRELFIRKARASLAQRKNRKNGATRQKNFILSKPTIKALEKFSKTYQISEAQIVSILINAEEKTPMHLATFKKRLDAIAKATGEDVHSNDDDKPSRDKDIFGD